MPRPSRSADVFDAIADPSRRTILGALDLTPCTVATLVDRIGTSQPAVSQHLGVLRDAGLVTVVAEGRQRWYSLRADGLRPVAEWLCAFSSWSASLDRLAALLEPRHEPALRS